MAPSPSDTHQLPSEHVIELVARFVNSDPTDLPPLYDTIDPDALDAVITTLTAGQVAFEYAGQYVTVMSDGSARLTPKPSSDADQPAPADD